MNASQKFKFIEQNLSNMLVMITASKEFARYVYYLDDNPLDTEKSDVTVDLIDSGNIILDLFDETILTEAQIKIFFNPFDGSLETQPLGYDIFTLDIVMPKRYWRLKGLGQFRAYRIAYEIAQKIDGKNVAGIGKVEITKYRTFKTSEGKYCGLTLFIRANSITN